MCKPTTKDIILANDKKIQEGKHILLESTEYFSERHKKSVLNGLTELIIKMHALRNIYKPADDCIISLQESLLSYIRVHL